MVSSSIVDESTPLRISPSRYDNEYGYSNRVVDLIKYIAKKDHGK